MSRRGARLYHTSGNRDRNEKPITDALEARGYVVTQIRGRGVPDLLVSKGGAMWLVEIKQPKGGFTPAQVTWRTRWTGPTVATIRTVDEALAWAPVGLASPQ